MSGDDAAAGEFRSERLVQSSNQNPESGTPSVQPVGQGEPKFTLAETEDQMLDRLWEGLDINGFSTRRIAYGLARAVIAERANVGTDPDPLLALKQVAIILLECRCYGMGMPDDHFMFPGARHRECEALFDIGLAEHHPKGLLTQMHESPTMTGEGSARKSHAYRLTSDGKRFAERWRNELRRVQNAPTGPAKAPDAVGGTAEGGAA